MRVRCLAGSAAVYIRSTATVLILNRRRRVRLLTLGGLERQALERRAIEQTFDSTAPGGAVNFTLA
jgi:hypothetical protein